MSETEDSGSRGGVDGPGRLTEFRVVTRDGGVPVGVTATAFAAAGLVILALPDGDRIALHGELARAVGACLIQAATVGLTPEDVGRLLRVQTLTAGGWAPCWQPATPPGGSGLPATGGPDSDRGHR